MKIKKTSLALFFMMLLFPTQTFGNKCMVHLQNATIVVLPQNVAVLETSLLELNKEFQRLDQHHDNQPLTADEVDEITSQETTIYKNETDIRLIYISRLNVLRIKIVEKLVEIYLSQFQEEYFEIKIDPENVRKILHSVVLQTTIRQFDPDNITTLIRISCITLELLKLKNEVEGLNSEKNILKNRIQEIESRLKHPKKSLTHRRATEDQKHLVELIGKKTEKMNKLNRSIMEEFTKIPEYESTFDLDAFNKWLTLNNDRSYLDELIRLEQEFTPKKNWIPGCCGDGCGLTCPYLTRMSVTPSNLAHLPSDPTMAVYKAYSIFKNSLPDSALAFPLRPAMLRKQIMLLKETD